MLLYPFCLAHLRLPLAASLSEGRDRSKDKLSPGGLSAELSLRDAGLDKISPALSNDLSIKLPKVKGRSRTSSSYSKE